MQQMTRRQATLGAALLLGMPAWAQSRDLLVFAAASLKNALDDAIALYASNTGKTPPKISYAASNTLAKQIEQGAPADIFLSADLVWMDYLSAKGLIRAESRINLLGNRLVLIAGKGFSGTIELKPGLNLAAALSGGRLALCSEAVPAGRYGKAALEKLGAYIGVKDNLAPAENVRAALLFVARGEAPLGIVYATDAAAEPSVKILATFAAELHPPIIYPAAITTTSANPDAATFLAFLRSAVARPAFVNQGFTFLNRPATGI